MHFIDDVFKEIKDRGHLEELRALPTVQERWKRLEEIMPLLNILKENMSFLSSDEQLYLDCKLQDKGIDMGLCQHYYVFWSTKNQKFHYTCKAANKERTHCGGNAEKCDKGLLNPQSAQ